jgi:hypothetical protein
MVKARGKVTRSTTPSRVVIGALGEPEIQIAAWCPDSEAKAPPEQVHLVNIIPGLEEYPIIMRFKSPDTLGFLIEELTKYRREVWPDAEPVNGDPLDYS